MTKHLALRALSVTAAGLVVMLTSALIVVLVMNPDLIRNATGTGERVVIGGSFELIDTKGNTVTQALVEDTPYAIFFGFTYCPEICPTTLAEFSQWIDQMGSDADKMKFLFVTIDPERDTPDVLADYVGAFSERIIGLTGSQKQVDAAVKAYRIYTRRVELDGGDYTMDHSAAVLLFDDDGELQSTINYTGTMDEALEKLRRVART